MRVAVIVPGFSAGDDDWCIPALLDLVRGLASNHDIEVFALRYPPVPRSYHVAGVRVHALGGGDLAGPRRLALLLRAASAIRERHRAAPFDVLHGFWADEPGFMAVSLAATFEIPSVVSVLGGELVDLPDIRYGGARSRLNRWLSSRALARAERVTVGSAFLAEIVAASVAPRRLVALPLGVDTALFTSSGPNVALVGDPAILSVGSLVPVKGHQTLLRAVAIASHDLPDIHLHLVGEGPERPDLKRMARSLGLEARVTFHGAISHEQLPAYYRGASFCALASRYESQSLVLLEAAACARVTVGSAVGLLPEVTPADWLGPPDDPTRLARVIVAAAGDSARRASVEQALTAEVDEHFSMDWTVSRLDRLYHDVACAATRHRD